MAKIISKFPANLLIHAGVLQVAGTLILCYILAVLFGHVPAWLPMISDCAVESPEKYPFRLGLVVGASLLALEVTCVYLADKSYSRNELCLVIGVVASAGLGVVAVVNEKECYPVHTGGAVFFFGGYWIYMIFMTWLDTPGQKLSSPSTIVKQVATVFCGFTFVAMGILALAPGDTGVYIALCEWTATFCILTFQWSFALDLTYLELAEIREDVLPPPTKAAIQTGWEAPSMEKKVAL